ncbi:MAG: cell wall-binding repeat-containing protein [Actinomycetota bacterium]
MGLRRAAGASLPVTLAALVALSGTPLGAAPRTAEVSPNRRATVIVPPTRLYEAPALAARGRNVALAVTDYERGSCQLWFSADSGRSWEERKSPQTPELSDCSFAGFNGTRDLALAPDGALLYAFRAGPGDSGSDQVALSHDGGRSWSIVLSPAGTNTRVRFASRERAYALWGEGGQLVVSASADGGRTFADPVVAVPSAQRPSAGRLEVGPEGELYVFYLDRSRTDPVFAFGPPRVAMAASRDEGATWTTSVVDAGAPRGLFSTQIPVGAVDPSTGDISVVWADIRNGLYPGTGEGNILVRDWDVFASTSTDGGETWSPAARVNDNPVGDVTIQYRPWIAAGDGVVQVAWYDYRHDPAGGNGADAFDQPGLADVYAATSDDGGQTFSANRRVTDRPINRFQGIWSCCFIQAPLQLATVPGGALAAWSDTRLGNFITGAQDIFTSKVAPGGRSDAITTRVHARRRAAWVTLSQLAFPAGGTAGQANGDYSKATVVIAPEDDVPLELVAATLARDRGGSLLVTAASGLDPATEAEVRRLRAERAFLVGDAEQIGPAVEEDLRRAGIEDLQRIAGSDRFDTARRVAELVTPMPSYNPTAHPVPDNTAVIILGEPDAAAAAEAATAAGIAPLLDLPVLFVTEAEVPLATRRAIAERGIRHTLVVASPERVPDDVMAQLPDPTRLGAGTGQRTSVKVADELLARGGPSNVALLAPNDPATVIATGAAAGRVGAVVLVLVGADLKAASSAWLKAHASGLDRIYVLPGR